MSGGVVLSLKEELFEPVRKEFGMVSPVSPSRKSELQMIGQLNIEQRGDVDFYVEGRDPPDEVLFCDIRGAGRDVTVGHDGLARIV